MKDNKNNKAKIYMIFSLVVLVIVVIVSGTYAYYVWTTSDSDTTKIVAGIGAATVTFDGGSDISANLRPVSDKSKGIVKNISVKGDTEGLVFNMYLDITSIDTGLKDESFRYELYKGTTKVKEGNFSDSYLTSNTVTCTKNNTNHIVLLTNESISTSKTLYTLYIWIDGANYTNPNTMMNKTFSFKLHADGEGAVLNTPLGNAVEYITNLYTNAEKETVTNNSITYNTAPSVSLMNDRLGGTTEDLDGGNIRYYGASPNNYVYFNCEIYPDTNCEIWRIIGVFDGKLKLIRNESIGNLAYDQDKNEDSSKTTYDNNWSTATLQKLLNGSYYNGSGTVTYYSGSTATGTTSLDMTNIGIKNNITRSLISETTYYLGGWTTGEIYSNQIYEYERGTIVPSGNSAIWIGKIALAYPSDYGYAADFNQCVDKQLSSYSTCKSNNWIIMEVMPYYAWLLTPHSRYSFIGWFAYTSGGIRFDYGYIGSADNNRVNPTLYLDSELGIESGDGSSSNPYKLSV